MATSAAYRNGFFLAKSLHVLGFCRIKNKMHSLDMADAELSGTFRVVSAQRLAMVPAAIYTPTQILVAAQKRHRQVTLIVPNDELDVFHSHQNQHDRRATRWFFVCTNGLPSGYTTLFYQSQYYILERHSKVRRLNSFTIVRKVS